MSGLLLVKYKASETQIGEVFVHQLQIWNIDASGKILFIADRQKQPGDQSYSVICIKFQSLEDAEQFAESVKSHPNFRSQYHTTIQLLSSKGLPDISLPNVLY